MGARRARPKASTLRTYERFVQAALLENGQLSHHVKRWSSSSRKVLRTALYRLGYKRQAVEVQVHARESA